jgi:hypothetical protein
MNQTKKKSSMSEINVFDPLVKTGNIAVDMTVAALRHYRIHHRRVQYVNLATNFWNTFKKWMEENAPEQPFTDEGIAFDHGGQTVIIRKGHRFMTQNLEAQLYPDMKKAEA